MKAKAECATTEGENDHTCFFCERPLDMRHYVKAYMDEAGTEALVRRFHPHGAHGDVRFIRRTTLATGEEGE